MKEHHERTRDVVVVGASAGGVEALGGLVAGLAADLRAAVFVVMHVSPSATSVLPSILGRAGSLTVEHARDGDDVELGRVYVAPPDRHLLLETGTVRVVGGPKQNGHRPAIDPLFRTAARAYGAGLIGVVLSGTLDDGAAGLLAIRRAGGETIVQDPTEAVFGEMPRHAIDVATPDYVLPVAEIAELLNGLVGAAKPVLHVNPRSHELGGLPELEGDDDRERRGSVSAFSCPECNGALWEIADGELTRFRCRVGHAYTSESLDAGQGASVEAALWSSLRALEERIEYAARLVARLEAAGSSTSANRFRHRLETDERHAAVLRDVIYQHEAAALVDPFLGGPRSGAT